MDAFERASLQYPNLDLVSRKLDLATEEEVDALERKWGFALPTGYREFITKVGACLYCDDLAIPGPKSLLKGPLTMGEVTGDYNPWEPADSGLTHEQIMELYSFGNTAGGDYVGLHPSQPKMIFFLPEGDDNVIRTNSDEVPFPDFYWRCVEHDSDEAVFRYAQSYASRHYAQINLAGETRSVEEAAFKTALTERWAQAGLHLEHRTFGSGCEQDQYFLRSIDGWINISMDRGNPQIRLITYSIDKDHLPEVTEFFESLGLA
jgi:hypothetical protein